MQSEHLGLQPDTSIVLYNLALKIVSKIGHTHPVYYIRGNIFRDFNSMLCWFTLCFTSVLSKRGPSMLKKGNYQSIQMDLLDSKQGSKKKLSPTTVKTNSQSGDRF